MTVFATHHAILDAFHAMALRPDDQWMRDDPDARAEIEANITTFPSAALPSPVDPSVIFGVVVRHGVGTVWMVVGDRFKDTWRGIVRMHCLYAQAVVKVTKVRRLQMLVDDAQPSHKRYAEAIGFVRESVAPHVGLGPRGENLVFYTWKGK